MNLIIVESPTKARTLTRFLGKEYQVDSTMGHIRDLPGSRIGIDIEKNFEPEYVLVEGKTKVVDGIKKLSKKSSRIYLATDPDREGEAIAWHISQLLSNEAMRQLNKGSPIAQSPNRPIARIVFHEITEEAVRHAIENPRSIDTDLVHAQQARRILDRLVGYKLSPLLWKKVRRGLSAGRVQSVAVRLIVEREREIQAFKADEYWEVWVEVSKGGEVPKVSKAGSRRALDTSDAFGTFDTFRIKLIEKDEEKAKIGNKETAGEIVSDLEKAEYGVTSINKREVHKSPYPPFTTSTMTQAAARTFFWSAKRTMSTAQKLYEEGLITYHRTDSTNLSQQALNMTRFFIKEKYGDSYLPERTRIYKTKSKVAQEAHEAIRPTQVQVLSNKEEVMGLGNDAKKLYELIWKRFVACQMAQAVYDETTVDVQAEGTSGVKKASVYLLRAGGQIIKFDGWKKLFPKGEEAVQLPEVSKGEKLQLIEVLPEQKFTEPLPRYNEASLIKTLEKLGIGRPSTYAPIIHTIQERKYVEKKEGRFYPTPVGESVNDFLIKYFPDIVDYGFTAHMEEDLDEIANGKKKWLPIISEFWAPFNKKLSEVEKSAQRVKIEFERTGKKCPQCGEGEQVIRVGKFGKFLSCSRFPECNWTSRYVETTGLRCPDCKEGDVIIKRTKRGKSFYGCSCYPACKFASWKKPKDSGEARLS